MTRLAGPAIGHMLLLTLVFAVDRFVLGRTDTVGLASLQISTVLVWTLTSVFTAFSAGTLAVAGRAFGANDRKSAAQAVTASLAFALLLGAIVAASSLLVLRPMLALVFPIAGDAVLGDVHAYLAIVLPVLPLAFAEAVAAASLQSTGDTRTPLWAAAASNVLNLALSCVLVFGWLGAPAMGVRGAAIGAAAATIVQAVTLMIVLCRKDGPLPVREVLQRPREIEHAIVSRLVRVSLPAFGDKLVYAGAYFMFVGFIAWLGPRAMAANQAISSIEAICFLSAEGFGIAAGALVAQRLGAGAPRKAAEVARVAAAMSVTIVTVCALVFVAAPRGLLGVFSTDRSVVDAALLPLLLAALSQPFMAYATVTRMALRGAGATAPVLYVTLAGTLLVRMPVAYLGIVSGWGLTGIWLASALDWIVEAVAFGWMLRHASDKGLGGICLDRRS